MIIHLGLVHGDHLELMWDIGDLEHCLAFQRGQRYCCRNARFLAKHASLLPLSEWVEASWENFDFLFVG